LTLSEPKLPSVSFAGATAHEKNGSSLFFQMASGSNRFKRRAMSQKRVFETFKRRRTRATAGKMIKRLNAALFPKTGTPKRLAASNALSISTQTTRAPALMLYAQSGT
jgi:hypothetical protein